MKVKENLARLKNSLLGRSTFNNKKLELDEAFLLLLEEVSQLAENVEELIEKVNKLEENHKKVIFAIKRGPSRYR